MIHKLVLAATLLMFRGASGQMIYINPEEVTVVTGPSVAQLAEHVKCVIGLTNGKFVSVADDCDTVLNKIEEAK